MAHEEQNDPVAQSSTSKKSPTTSTADLSERDNKENTVVKEEETNDTEVFEEVVVEVEVFENFFMFMFVFFYYLPSSSSTPSFRLLLPPPIRGLSPCFLVLNFNFSYPRLGFPSSSSSFFLSLLPILSAPPSAVLCCAAFATGLALSTKTLPLSLTPSDSRNLILSMASCEREGGYRHCYLFIY